MASRKAIRRLTAEYKQLEANPEPFIEAHPSEDDILQWVYVLKGPDDTPYQGGRYMGMLNFPPDYPFAPPRIRMFTPSGRFEPGARLCLTMSDFHPETWNPAWNVTSILTGLLSFMCSSDVASGVVTTSDATKRKLAVMSHEWNARNAQFRKEFPDLVKIPPAGAQGTTANSASASACPPASSSATNAASMNQSNEVKESASAPLQNAGANRTWITTAAIVVVVLAAFIGVGHSK